MDDACLVGTFVPVVNFTVVRLLLATAAQNKSKVHQVDYSSVFLEGLLDKEIYMAVPTDIDKEYIDIVCRLKKTLYGPKESPKIWYELLSNNAREIGLKPLKSAPCVFFGHHVTVLCYADDLFLISKNESELKKLKMQLRLRFPANDLEEAAHFLGVKVIQGHDCLALVQK